MQLFLSQRLSKTCTHSCHTESTVAVVTAVQLNIKPALLNGSDSSKDANLPQDASCSGCFKVLMYTVAALLIRRFVTACEWTLPELTGRNKLLKIKPREFCAACWETARSQGERQTLLEQLVRLTGRHPSAPDERQQAPRETEGEAAVCTNKHGLAHLPEHWKYSHFSLSFRSIGSSLVFVASARVCALYFHYSGNAAGLLRASGCVCL